MAVAFDAKTAAWTNVNGVATMNVTNLTVGSGSNRALAVLLLCGSDGTGMPSGLTVVWDSGGTNQSCTLISSTSVANGPLAGSSALYGLVAPTSGNKTLTISWTGNSEMHACAISFTGVDQTSVAVAFPHGNTHSVVAGASPTTVTITSATGNMVVACHSQNLGSWGTISGTTLASDGVTGPNLSVAANYAAGASTVTLTAAFSGTGANISAGCDILASGGGTAWSGSATLPGAGNLSADTLQIMQAAATLSGAGALSPTANMKEQAAALLAASGHLSESDTLASPASATLSGSGGLIEGDTVQSPASALLAGAGSLSSTARMLEQAAALLAGVGHLSENDTLISPASATLAGAGGLASTANLLETASALLAGVGTLSADASTGANQWSAAALLAAAGNLTASALLLETASAALSGSGGVSATANLREQASALLGGAASLTESDVVVSPAAALLAGTGGLSADATVHSGANVWSAEALLSASGSLSSNSVTLQKISALLSASGGIEVAPSLMQSAQALLAGNGFLSAVAQGTATLWSASATLSGSGSLSGTAKLFRNTGQPINYVFNFVDELTALLDPIVGPYLRGNNHLFPLYPYNTSINSVRTLSGWWFMIDGDISLFQIFKNVPELQLVIDWQGLSYSDTRVLYSVLPDNVVRNLEITSAYGPYIYPDFATI